jgi:excinuclease ABC subunit C
MTTDLVLEQLRRLPDSPGVYLMKDATGRILYIGKALSLKNRVSSYFGKGPLTLKTENMVAKVHEIDFVITGSEQEALILEMNLIKRYQPPYNVQWLRDDKTFPFLKISVNEEWPRVYLTRRVEEDGGRYFGPFASADSVRQTLKVLKTMFPFRTCKKQITGTDKRACLEYHLNHCVAPCIGAVNHEEYIGAIKHVILFLEGRDDIVINQLKKQMEEAAESLGYEKAAIIRDQIKSINNVIEGQHIATMVKGEQDAIAFAQDGDQALAQIFFIRNGKLIGRENFVVKNTTDEEPVQIMTNFVKQFYNSSTYVPRLLLLQYRVEDLEVIKSWLSGKRGGTVDIEIPKRGLKKHLIDNVLQNAMKGLEQLRIKRLTATIDRQPALLEVQKELHLLRLPHRIEAYDISNIQGTSAVGSMVVMEDGKTRPSHYRRFRIKTVPGADDYAMLQEVLRRRFKRAAPDSGQEAGETWRIMPDLLLIDGGKGQLNAAISVVRELKLEEIYLAGLAKEREELFIPGQAEPVRLPADSAGRLMLQHLRDEAHRFALGYHLKVRRKVAMISALDSIPGIGPKRKRALLRKFGSVRAIKEASMTDLAGVNGISPKLVEKIKEYL